MSLSVASSVPAVNYPAYPAYPSLMATQTTPNYASSVYYADRLNIEPKPVPDPGDIPPPEDPGSIWNRGDVRVGLMMAGTATVGGAIGYFASRAAGTSLAMGTAVGATLGAALPIAMVIWALSRWGK